MVEERRTRPGSGRPYRTELQGLRAVAVGLVVVYHVFLDRVSGGVDVFLLISAFLLTGSFAARLEDGRPLAVVPFWIRTFKRLLPPAAVTILGVVVLMRVFLPATQWRETLAQALASLFYMENWRLASRSVDYYALDRAVASPFQHFWSLSIQGQVFLVWPLLFLLAAVAVRRLHLRPRATLTALFGAVFVASLAWSVWATAADQTHAYFDTFTRLWEFALGSLLALALPLVERRFGFGPRLGTGEHVLPRVIVGWVGMVSLVAVGLVVNVAGAFPGWIALWPLVSASLVIGAGHTGSRWGVDHWLSSRPLEALGDMSYALYLVHWPILVTLLVIKDADRLGRFDGLFVIAVSLHLAWALTRFVDAPVRTSATLRAEPARALVVIVLALVVAAAPVVLFRGWLDRQSARAIALAAENNPGAAVLTGASSGPADPASPTLPLLEDLSLDWLSLPDSCDGDSRPSDPDVAASCSESATGDPNRLIVAVGNSRLQQFVAALEPLAEFHDYKLQALLKGGCPLSLEEDELGDECFAWNRAAVDHLIQLRPVAVYTTTTWVNEDGEEVVLDGIAPVIDELTANGIAVIGLRDQPRLSFNPNACAPSQSEEACTVSTGRHYLQAEANVDLVVAAADPALYHPIDLLPRICPDGSCSPVIGNVRVYLDGNHLTRTYARTLASTLDEQLARTGWQW